MSALAIDFFFYCYGDPRDLHSFPTRRSSDLQRARQRRPPAQRTRAQEDELPVRVRTRSEEHTSELQSPDHLVCRLLLEKKKNSPPHHIVHSCHKSRPRLPVRGTSRDRRADGG